MWHSLGAFIKYRLTAKTKYSIHSPFVYHLVTEVLEKDLDKSLAQSLHNYKAALLQDNDSIEVTDFGAGSRIFKSTRRPVHAIAKHVGISKIKSDFLQKLIYHFKPKNILEMGTSLGIASAAMAIAYPNASITSLEGCPETSKKAQEYFDKFQLNQIQLVVGEFSSQLPIILKNSDFDFIYFDGNHQKNATLDYFNQCLPKAHNDTLFVFDDIHWSKGMEEAWEEIKNHPKTSVCIDLYHLGFVFFRKEQVAQNFVIRV
jgi:predicted O-methyltransferase YrrM